MGTAVGTEVAVGVGAATVGAGVGSLLHAAITRTNPIMTANTIDADKKPPNFPATILPFTLNLDVT